MNQDPIVNEIRKVGAQLAAEAGHDVHRFFEILREAERTYDRPLVREPVTVRSSKQSDILQEAEDTSLSSPSVGERRRKNAS